MAEHTPTPWAFDVHINEITHSPFASIWSGSGVDTVDIAYLTLSRAGPNAAFIVKAVNSHDALVEAAQSLIDEIGSSGTHQCWKRLANVIHAIKESADA